MEIEAELRRIYRFDEPWEASDFEDLSEEEQSTWDELPEELQRLALFVGREETLPHPRVGMVYGPFELVEWNGPDGTFGQLRSLDPAYPYDRVVKFGDDAFLDPAGQLGEPGGVYRAIGHDLDAPERLAPSLLALLRSAGSYRT